MNLWRLNSRSLLRLRCGPTYLPTLACVSRSRHPSYSYSLPISYLSPAHLRSLPTVSYLHSPIMAPLRLRIDGRTFRDPSNREVTLHGINVAGDAKFPATPDQPSHVADDFFDGDNVSFVGRPFTVDGARLHFTRLRKMGYNTIRYIFTWEAIEHAGPKKYDEDWIQHTISVLRVAKEFGFYVFMDPHQDVVRRRNVIRHPCAVISN